MHHIPAMRLFTAMLISLAGPALSLEEYLSLTAEDSSLVGSAPVERFVWKSSFDCHYVVLRHRGDEVKGTLVLLHGAGDNPTNFSKIAPRLDVPALDHLVPQAPFPMTVRLNNPLTGEPASYLGYGWLNPDRSAWVDRGMALSVFLLDRILAESFPSHPQSPPVYVLGFRQGAGIASLWAATHSERVGGLVLVSGHADEPVKAALRAAGLGLAHVPCLVVTGTESSTALASGELGIIMQELGADVETHYLRRAAEFSEDDYPLIREFLTRLIGREDRFPAQ